MENKKNTHIIKIIDASGSMFPIKNDTIGGFNSFFEDQKKANINQLGDLTVSIYVFNNTINSICRMKSLNDIPDISSLYKPSGCTALYDAIGEAINQTDIDLKDKDNIEKVICVIITDGQENSSKSFSQNAINELIDSKKNEKWEFIFIGANQDSFQSGSQISINKHVLDFSSTSRGVQEMYATLSKGVGRARSLSYEDFKNTNNFLENSDIN